MYFYIGDNFSSCKGYTVDISLVNLVVTEFVTIRLQGPWVQYPVQPFIF